TIRDQLVAAVEDRAFVAFMLKDTPLVERLLRIAQLADSGSPWRERFRHAAVWRDGPQLLELAATAFTSSPPPSDYQLALLGMLLCETGAKAQGTSLLGEACRRHPRNFWAYREMGAALLTRGEIWQATAYFRAARTLRPDNAYIHERLGW